MQEPSAYPEERLDTISSSPNLDSRSGIGRCQTQPTRGIVANQATSSHIPRAKIQSRKAKGEGGFPMSFPAVSARFRGSRGSK